MQFGAITGGEFVFRLGAPLMALVASGMKALDARAVGVIQRGIAPQDFQWAIEQLRAGTKILIVDEAGAPDPRTGQKKANWFPFEDQYDEHFAGNYREWLEWVQFALEVNFGSFFGESTAADPAAKDSLPSNSQNTSDGQPGASSATPA